MIRIITIEREYGCGGGTMPILTYLKKFSRISIVR